MRGVTATRVLAVCLATLLAACGSGITASSSSPASAPIPSIAPSASPTTTAAPTPTPTPSPIPVGYSTGADGSLTYTTTTGAALKVPVIPGLVAGLADGKVTYTALASNPYGLKMGAYAGQFAPDVTVGSAPTGGVVLEGAVVAKLITDRLAAIPAQKDKWVIPLPVDIRGTKSTVAVTTDNGGFPDWKPTPRVLVSFAGSAPLVNPRPQNEGYRIVLSDQAAETWLFCDPYLVLRLNGGIVPGHEMSFVVTYGTDKTDISSQIEHGESVSVGYKVAEIWSNASIVIGTNVGGYLAIGADKLLNVAQVPVFIAAN